ncbi:MAG: PQQ-dependent sugar dehydrogenase, partial [Pirellulales bacterium]
MPLFRLVAAALLALSAFGSVVAADAMPKPLLTGLKNPESVAIGSDGRTYISVIGEFDVDGDGSIVVVEDGKAVPFVEGLDDPKGLVAHDGSLFVADKRHVLQIDKTGLLKRFAPANAFPTTPKFLNDLAVDAESGTLFVSDSGDLMGNDGAVYRISTRGLVDVVVNQKNLPELSTPNGLLLDGASHLLLGDFGTGTLYRIKLADRSYEKLADGLGGTDGLAWDRHGRLFTSDWKDGRVFVIGRSGDKPKLLASGFKSAADICLDASAKMILVPDMMGGTLTALTAEVPDEAVDDSPLPLAAKVAFPDLEWTGWQGETDAGEIVPLRPIVLTHAGDGSNRVFVAEQHGTVHVFANQNKPAKTEIFLDITDRVRYSDKTNEEGLLGVTFHPKFKENGELFVFYTPNKADAPYVNLLSRFRLKSDNPKQADPSSEEVLLRIEHPFWNHDGGTVCFGTDGYLYVALGDGGFGNDLYANGQSLDTLLGKLLR